MNRRRFLETGVGAGIGAALASPTVGNAAEDRTRAEIDALFESRGNTKPWYVYPALSQIPILGWGLERIYQRNADKELLRQSLPPLEKFHDARPTHHQVPVEGQRLRMSQYRICY